MSEILKVVPEAGQLTYNQRAMNLVLEVPENDISNIYAEVVNSCFELVDDEYMETSDCLSLMEMCADVHAKMFAEYILYKIFGDEAAGDLWDDVSRITEFLPEHLQNILDEVDGGRTVDQILNGDYDEDEEMDDE